MNPVNNPAQSVETGCSLERTSVHSEHDQYPAIGDVVVVRWRDSFQQNGQLAQADIGGDCLWDSYGEVVASNDLFLSIAFGVEQDSDQRADVLHILRDQIVCVTTLRRTDG